jgi:hypothetical protein
MSPQDKHSFHLFWFFNKTFYEMILEFMGQKWVFNPPHIQDFTWKSSTIHKPSGLNVEDLIDLNNFEMKHDDCVYHEDLSQTDKSWAFGNNVSSPQRTMPHLHSPSFMEATNETSNHVNQVYMYPRAHPNAHLDANPNAKTNEWCI